jgi:hypothetical protein
VRASAAPVLNLQQLAQYFVNPAAAMPRYKERFIIHANNNWMPVETTDIAVVYKDYLN